MSPFSDWLEEQKNESPSSSNRKNLSLGQIFSINTKDSPDDSRNDGANDSQQTLPLFNTNLDLESGLGSIKSSLEAQLPQRVLGMNYQQRFKVFSALLFLSAVFFALAFGVGLPMIAVRPQKFALSFTFGSLTFMGSFAILRGPITHLLGMLTMERLPFTTAYIGSMLATLHFTFLAGGINGYVLVLFASGLQLLTLLWYLITFLPGGAQGMKFLTSAILAIIRPFFLSCIKCFSSLFGKIIGRIIS